MQSLTDLENKLLEVRKLQSQVDKKKAELDKQIRQLLQNKSELDKLMEQARQKESLVQCQIIELKSLEVRTHAPEIEYFATGASKSLQNNLLNLLSGNGYVAIRLLKHQQLINPGKSANWYLEKVIYDLKRDRHC
jgi:predicted nuclease with TOPRIM domain